MNASSRFRLTALVAVFVFLTAGLLLARSSRAPAAPVHRHVFAEEESHEI